LEKKVREVCSRGEPPIGKGGKRGSTKKARSRAQRGVCGRKKIGGEEKKPMKITERGTEMAASRVGRTLGRIIHKGDGKIIRAKWGKCLEVGKNPTAKESINNRLESFTDLRGST